MRKEALVGILVLILFLIPSPIDAYGAIDIVNESLEYSEFEFNHIIPARYDPLPAQPGKFVTVWLVIENVGTDTIEDATFKIEPEYPFTLRQGDDPFFYYGDIVRGQQAQLEFKFYVNPNAIEGTYKSYLKLCQNSACTISSRKPFSIQVRTGGEPKIEVGLEEAPILTAGKTDTIVINIVNRGKVDTKFMNLILEESEYYEIITPTKIYIGELDSDDFETAEFMIYIRAGVGIKETETINLPFVVDYTDENDKDHYDTQTVELKIYSGKDLKKMDLAPTNSSLNGVIFILLIIALFLGYRYWKKKNKKK